MRTSIVEIMSGIGNFMLWLGLFVLVLLLPGCASIDCPPPPPPPAPCVSGAAIVDDAVVVEYDATEYEVDPSEPIEIIVPGAVQLESEEYADDYAEEYDAEKVMEESASAAPKGPIRVKVKFLRAIDGNTVHVLWDAEDIGIALAGVKAPALGEDGYDAAGLALRNLITSDEIELEFPDGTIKQDDKGRLQAVVWIDGKNINDAMLKSGKVKSGESKGESDKAKPEPKKEKADKTENANI